MRILDDKRWFVVMVIMSSWLMCHGQSIETDDGVLHWEGGATAGLNNDGYMIDLDVAYFPTQYVGLKATLGFAGEIEEMGDWGLEEWEKSHDYAMRLKINPSIVLRSPKIINWKSQAGGWYIFAEPGIVLSPGAVGSRHARVACWDFKTGVNLQLDRIVISLGYGISNFSLYSGRPYSYWGSPDKDNYITHTVFCRFTYKF